MIALDLSAIAPLLAVPAILPVLLFLLAWPIVRYVLIPLGLPRLSFYVTHLAFLIWTGRPDRGAVIAAAWAASMSGRDQRDVLDWLEGILRARDAFGVAEVTAYGLISAKRGQREDARMLLSSAEELADNHPPTLARALAAEWVAADAAEQGDWERAYTSAQNGLPTRASRLLGAVAGHLTGRAPVADATLWFLWLIAPHRRRTLPMVKRALGQASGSATVGAPESVVLPHDDDPFLRALTLHAALLRRPPSALLLEDVVRLGRTWDEALEDQKINSQLRARATALGVSAPRVVFETLRSSVEADVVKLASAARLALGRTDVRGPIVEGALKQLRTAKLAELELAAKAMEARIEDKRRLPTVDEWREWLKLRAAAEDAIALGDSTLHRLVFSAVHSAFCALAVWLFNERKERHAAHAIFAWLLKNAERVEDVEAIRLQRSNVTASRR